MNSEEILGKLRELHTVGNSHSDFETALELFDELDINLRNGKTPPQSWNNSYTKAHKLIGNTPEAVANGLRELSHSGISVVQFGEFKELFSILDMWLQDGGNPPVDWEGAFDEKSCD